jgi:hypothetical protein
VNLNKKRKRVTSNAPESDDNVEDPDILIRQEQFKEQFLTKRHKQDDYSELYKIDDSSTIFAGFSSPHQKEESFESQEQQPKHSSHESSKQPILSTIKDEIMTEYDDRSLLTSSNYRPKMSVVQTNKKSLSMRFSEVDF